MPHPTLTCLALAIMTAAFLHTAAAQGDALSSGSSIADMLAPNQTYWHMWADASGEGHLSKCALTNFTAHVYLPPTPPVWLDSFANPAAARFLQAPVGWTGTWHKDPVPQLVLFVSGHGEWTAEDGTSHVFGPGDVYFGNDQMSHKGHMSRTVGNEPMMCVLIQFPQWATNMAKPCWLV